MGTQLPLLTVQRTVALNPDPTPVTVVVVLNVLVIVAAPACKLHSPVPTAGDMAAITNVLVLHWSMFTPPSAIEGEALLVSTTSSKLGVHTPLLIVHRNVTLLPAVRPVTPLTFEAGAVITVPFGAPTIVHNPELTVGTFPANVNIPLPQFPWSAPAEDTVGVAFIVTTTGLISKHNAAVVPLM